MQGAGLIARRVARAPDTRRSPRYGRARGVGDVAGDRGDLQAMSEALCSWSSRGPSSASSLRTSSVSCTSTCGRRTSTIVRTMNAVGADQSFPDRVRLESFLREVVQTLAPMDRTPCSLGERHAAEWLAARLRTVAGVDVALEDEPSWGTFPPTATGLGLLGMVGAALVLCGHRGSGALLAAATFAGIVDEAQNGPRILRRIVRRRRRTVNLVARVGEQDIGMQEPAGRLVVLAHTTPLRRDCCATRRSSVAYTRWRRRCSNAQGPAAAVVDRSRGRPRDGCRRSLQAPPANEPWTAPTLRQRPS